MTKVNIWTSSATLVGIAAFLISPYINDHLKSVREQPGKPLEELLYVNRTLDKMCPRDKVWPVYPNLLHKKLNCFCKKHATFKTGCLAKMEILNVKPLMFVAHGFFKRDSERILQAVSEQKLRRPTYSNKFGFQWHSPEMNHLQSLLDGKNKANHEAYDKMARLVGAEVPCPQKREYPTMNIAKYSKGAFLTIHHDAHGSHITNKTGIKDSFSDAIRRVVVIFEDCRTFFSDLNYMKCLYLRIKGELPPSIYWTYETFGPPIGSGLIQLSDVPGGETIFPELDLSVHTNYGDMLYFENLDEQGRQLKESLHGACPTLLDGKLIVVGRFPGLCNKIEHLRQIILSEYF